MFYYERYQARRRQRILSDIRYCVRKYASVVADGLMEMIAGLGFFVTTLFIIPAFLTCFVR